MRAPVVCACILSTREWSVVGVQCVARTNKTYDSPAGGPRCREDRSFRDLFSHVCSLSRDDERGRACLTKKDVCTYARTQSHTIRFEYHDTCVNEYDGCIASRGP